MLMKTLRDDQALAIDNLREELKQGQNRIVLQGPTGMGKTVIIADIVDRALQRNRKVLITVPAISLIDQTVEALANQGMRDVGVIQAQHPMTDWSRPVQVASVQTLVHRWKDREMPKADLVLVDEVHRWFTIFPQWMLDKDWLAVPFIGFSATPWTKGLGSLYTRLIVANNIAELIARKVLVPFRTFAPDTPDLTGVRQQAGDFVASDLEEVMRPKKLTANIVATWKELALDRPTVCFCCSRAHAEQLAKEFEEAGVGAAFMDCNTPLLERQAIRRQMLRDEVKVVCNVEIVGIGVDWPEVSCVIYARPTMSDIRFVQNVGRGLRAAEGKTDLLILDHSSTTQRLGFVDEIYTYHPILDDGKTKAETQVAIALPKECPKCHMLKAPRASVCPHCGHKVEEHASAVAVERGTLREVKVGDEMDSLRKRLPDKAHCFGQLWWWGIKKGYKPGWAAVKTKEIFGSFPRAREPEPDMMGSPVPELLEYIFKSTEKWKRQQSYAKRTVARQRTAQERAAHDDAILAEVRNKFVEGTLATEQDLEDFQ